MAARFRRARHITAAASALATCVLLGAHAAPAAGSGQMSWPQYGFDPGRSNFNNYEDLLSTRTVVHLRREWTFRQTTGEFLATPAVAGGVLYAAACDGAVYALDAATGRRLWRNLTVQACFSSPAVYGGGVFIGSNRQHALFALRASTGKVLWKLAMRNFTYAAPAVADGVVYADDASGQVYAVGASSGRLIWSHNTGTALAAPVTVSAGVVYAGNAGKGMVALDAASGRQLWTFAAPETSQVFLNYATVVGPAAYLTQPDRMYAISTITHHTLWSAPAASGSGGGSQAVAGGVLVQANNGASCMDARHADDGRLLWTFCDSGYLSCTPSIADGVVYIGQSGYPHRLYAVSLRTGKKLWSYQLPAAAVFGSPVAVAGMLYAETYSSTRSGVLYAFGLP
jgi:outer membrane protein assembly factor BamB